jgi:FkbM family methyltransferase
MRNILKHIAQQFGYDILRVPTDPIARQQRDLFSKYGINLVFDIGANVGQYATRLRQSGYKGRIISFEPLPDEYDKIDRLSSADPKWIPVNTAIGNSIGRTSINVSQNSYSSSILDILPVHVESAPESTYTHRIEVPINTVDNVIDRYYFDGCGLYIKIDTQGFEMEVFKGCLKSLNRIRGFQMELSLVPLYSGEMLMHDMVSVLRDHGFKLVLMEAGHRNYTTGELLQVEGYFYRPDPIH